MFIKILGNIMSKPMEKMMDEYFCKKQCCYWSEYPESYGRLNVEGKTVTLVGADCGSTFLYLILRGAKKLIGYEKEERLRKEWEKVCQEFNICSFAEMRGEWKGEYDNTDIFLMDCEGCEESLDFTKLYKYKAWCIAVHEWTKNRTFLMKNLQGSTLTFITDDGKELMFCKGV